VNSSWQNRHILFDPISLLTLAEIKDTLQGNNGGINDFPWSLMPHNLGIVPHDKVGIILQCKPVSLVLTNEIPDSQKQGALSEKQENIG